MKNRMKRPKEGMVEATSVGARISNVIGTLLLCVVIFCCVIPIWHVVMSSISDGRALFAHEGLVFFPQGKINFEGYVQALSGGNILRSYIVTIFYVVSITGIGLVMNVLGGYVLSQKSKLKPLLTMILVFSMMFNGGVVPTYMVVSKIGLSGTPWALILPGCTNAIFIIMMMNAFLQIPKETVEAAQMDGAGHLRMMFQVMLPQAKGFALVTVVNSALMAWNMWFEATIYLPTQKDWWPLQLWIRELTSRNQDFLNYANPNYNRYLIQYVVIVIATLPILLIFPFFQKRLEENMTVGAVKG